MQAGIRKTAAGVRIGFRGRPVLFDAAAAELAGAGTNQSTASQLVSPVTSVSGADATVGVRLPVPGMAGRIMVVYSSAATNALKVYPATGGTINNGSANASVNLAARVLGLFISTSATNWAHAVNA